MAPQPENWNQMLSQFAGAYASAKETNDWMPPDGEYMVVLVEVDRGTFTDKKSGAVVPYFKPWVELQDGVDADGNTLVGRRFGLGFMSLMPTREGMLKTLVSRLAGATVNDLSVADGILSANIGTVLTVKVSTRESKGTMYTNAYVQKVVASASAPATPDAAAAPAPTE
jgi:hypothetical protein